MATDRSAAATKAKMDELHKEAVPHQTQAAGADQRTDKDLKTPRQQGVMDEQFPTGDLDATTEEDVRMATKLNLADEQGRTPFGQLIASDSDFDWLDRKRQAEDEANFQAWFAQVSFSEICTGERGHKHTSWRGDKHFAAYCDLAFPIRDTPIECTAGHGTDGWRRHIASGIGLTNTGQYVGRGKSPLLEQTRREHRSS